jgi:rhodanese-related sulfurtransferase
MKPVYALLIFFSLSLYACQSQPAGGLLGPKAFSEKVKSTPDAVVLDVRTPEEFAEGYIEKAINIDFYRPDFKSQIQKLDKSKSYFVYCKAGGRSASAAELMGKEGFKRVYDLDGGMTAWEENKFPVVH